MANQYYKKDIHKSIEGLLNGLYVYQYLLDTSTFGLILRLVVQDQILSLKTKAPTLRSALYVVLVTSFLGFFRHLHSPDRYAVIIDFIGNVSIPSRSKLIWLDIFITLLQITIALVLFDIRKPGADTRVVRVQGMPRTIPNSNTASSVRAPHELSTATVAPDSLAPNTTYNSRAASSPRADSRSSSSQPPVYGSLQVSEHNQRNNDSNNRDNELEGFYEDDEETRYSLDNPPRGRTENSARERVNSSGDSASDNSENDEDEDDPLGDDYEEILEQETFVIQLNFQDMTSYLFSSQEAFSFPRMPFSAVDIAAEAEAAQVQNLPV